MILTMLCLYPQLCKQRERDGETQRETYREKDCVEGERQTRDRKTERDRETDKRKTGRETERE